MIFKDVNNELPKIGDKVIVHASGCVDDIGIVEAATDETGDPLNALMYVNCNGTVWGIHSDGKQTEGDDAGMLEVELWLKLPSDDEIIF